MKSLTILNLFFLLLFPGGPLAAGEDACLMLVADNISRGGGNFYLYYLFSDQAVTFSKGDVLEYEIYLPEGLPRNRGGVDIWFEGNRTPLRDASHRGRRITDQNGIRAHGDGKLDCAEGRLYGRSIPLDGVAGGTSSGWYLVSEGDAFGCYLQFVDNVRVRKGDGTVVVIYDDGPPPRKEPGIVKGYSKFSTLEVVDRATAESAKGREDLLAEVESILERGRRQVLVEDLKKEAEAARAIIEKEGSALIDALEDVEPSIKALEEAVGEGDRFQEILEEVTDTLSRTRPVVKKCRGHLVGHAHIDFQWLWEWPETLQVCRDTFGQATAFMEEYQGFTFSQSSTALYAATEEHFPDLFERIRKHVKEGQWEIVGGRICEGDEHMISPESHARHFLYGQRYIRERFGRDATVGFEPDTFGHTAQMPQILKLGGCDCFYFCRGGNDIPLFWWEALDGTRVLAFEEAATGTWYNGSINQVQLEEAADFLGTYASPDSLWVYGVGNHGGGPTREHIESALALKRKAHTPEIEFSTVRSFFDAVREKVDLDGIPRVRGELNSSFHAGFYGTYTTHGDIKRWNRDAEAAAESAEVLAVAASFHGFEYPRAAFRKVWEDITWNHHHDTLPGTSIHPSYDKSRVMYEEATSTSRKIGKMALEHVAALLAPGEGRKLIVFNPLSWSRDGLVTFDLEGPPGKDLAAKDPQGRVHPVQIVERDGALQGCFLTSGLPSMGYRSYRIEPADGNWKNPLHAAERFIENENLRVEVDPAKGLITRIRHKAWGREFIDPKGSARLEVRFETPHNMSAWVIGEFLRERARPKWKQVKKVEEGPVRATLRMDGTFGDSALTQYLSLTRGGDMVEVRLVVDWKEKGGRERPSPFLKAVVDVGLEEAAACYEVPFGALERPSDGTEVPALKWADLSGEGYGLSLINDCKHGYSAEGGSLTLSLIRSSYSPDPEPDLGKHVIGYAFYPHAGSWKEAQTARKAAAFNKPLWVADVPSDARGVLPEERSYFALDSRSVLATGLKLAEDDDAVVFRCYESAGAKSAFKLSGFRPFDRADTVNFIEDVLGEAGISEGCIEEVMPPWRIRTYKIEVSGR